MAMCMTLLTVSALNIDRILSDPPLAWQLVARDEPAYYFKAREHELRRFGPPSDRRGLMSRILVGDSEVEPLWLGPDEGKHVCLDKAWAGLDFLLSRGPRQSPLRRFLLRGGETLPRLEIGWRPARLHRPAAVASISRALDSIDDVEIAARYDPQSLADSKVYPSIIWIRDGVLARDYLLGFLPALRAFVERAAAAQLGLAVIL